MGVVFSRQPMRRRIVQRPEIANSPIPERASVLASPNLSRGVEKQGSRVRSPSQGNGQGRNVPCVLPRRVLPIAHSVSRISPTSGDLSRAKRLGIPAAIAGIRSNPGRRRLQPLARIAFAPTSRIPLLALDQI